MISMAFLTHSALRAGWEMTRQHRGSEILWDLRCPDLKIHGGHSWVSVTVDLDDSVSVVTIFVHVSQCCSPEGCLKNDTRICRALWNCPCGFIQQTRAGRPVGTEGPQCRLQLPSHCPAVVQEAPARPWTPAPGSGFSPPPSVASRATCLSLSPDQAMATDSHCWASFTRGAAEGHVLRCPAFVPQPLCCSQHCLTRPQSRHTWSFLAPRLLLTAGLHSERSSWSCLTPVLSRSQPRLLQQTAQLGVTQQTLCITVLQAAI